MKAEIDAIIRQISHDDRSCCKVDLSDCKISYNTLKKLFAALGQNRTVFYLDLSGIGITATQLQLFENTIQRNKTVRYDHHSEIV